MVHLLLLIMNRFHILSYFPDGKVRELNFVWLEWYLPIAQTKDKSLCESEDIFASAQIRTFYCGPSWSKV